MILYISAMNNSGQKRQLFKTAVVYFAVSVFCMIFDQVYAMFGHGVRSASMSFMFLYPLIGGAAVFLLQFFILPAVSPGSYRFFYNIYHSGIAALTIKSMLYGIFEIAGTSSSYLTAFTVCGWVMMITGCSVLFIDMFLKKDYKE